MSDPSCKMMASPASTPVPANEIDTSSTGYVVATADAAAVSSSDFVTIFRVRKDSVGNATIGAPKPIRVPSFSVPAPAPQPGTTATLDTFDARLTQAVAAVDPRLGRMVVWTQHSVFGGAGSEVHWYELDPGTSTIGSKVYQSGKAGSSSLYAWNGAISPDRVVGPSGSGFGSDMVLSFSTSSAQSYPALRMVSKTGASAQRGVTTVKQSLGKDQDMSCSPCRWGDYAGASPDPSTRLSQTSGRVWLTGQYNVKSVTNSDVDWRTWIWEAAP